MNKKEFTLKYKMICLFMAFLLALLWPFSYLSVQADDKPAYDTADAVHISTAADLISFSQSCAMDTWSQGKLFVLDNDIDLSGTDFSPIPTFGGHFDGQGHAITGITLDGSGSNRGLFRYLQKSAVVEETDGKGFYPQDLKAEEFQNILIKMLKDGKDEDVAKIVNQRSVVFRDGENLKAIDYTELFKDEFEKMAQEFEKAAETSTNADFAEYLKLQAKALRVADPMADAYADKKWATLQDTPLELTITRECYDDTLSTSISENKELLGMLDERGIQVYPKDSLGCRVGIVNKESTNDLLKIKKFLPEMAKLMPFNDQYEQNIKPEGDSKQTMVDVDLLMLAGDCGAYRGGVTLAENLPNDDKMSLTIGGGRRNVYHRQIRLGAKPEKVKERLDAILDPEQHKYYNLEADHWFTIGHENTHSLGPTQGREKLGKYQSIIEEHKADVGAISCIDMLTEKGMYTEEQRLQILVSFAVDNFLKAKPELTQAHRVRSVMQTNFLERENAVVVNENGIIHVNVENVVSAAQKMLKEAIRVQLSQDVNEAEKYVNEYFVWDDACENVAKNVRKISKKLNGFLETPLADKLAEE